MNYYLIIQETTKLSTIAKYIENMPMGELINVEYYLGDHIYSTQLDSSKPTIDLNIQVLEWMLKCQVESN